MDCRGFRHCIAGEKQPENKRSKPLPLHEVLIYAILSRLPTKSVIRFMCVSKTWNSLIQDPYLLQLRQSLINPTDNLCLFVCPRACPKAVSYPVRWLPDIFLGHVRTHEDQRPLELNSSTRITTLPLSDYFDVQSVNGLLCFYPERNNSGIGTHICNPTTRQVVTLPRDNAIDFYPKFRLHTHFGYYPLENKFKVLVVILNEANSFEELRILTVGDYVWRNVAHSIPYKYDLKSDKEPLRCIGECVNGAIHWLDLTHKVILVFDLGSEQFRTIPIFGVLEKYSRLSSQLTLFSGCLRILTHMGRDFVDFSILKDYENQVWTNKRYSMQGIFFLYGVRGLLRTIYTEEIMMLPQNNVCVEFYVYYFNPKKMSYRYLEVVRIPSHYSPWEVRNMTTLFVYQENFARL